MNRLFSVAALAAVLLAAAACNAYAREWRVNNNPNRGAHFTDINAACASDEVQDGDVLYLDPGCSLTTAQTVTKQLTIVGTGYLHTTQPFGTANIGAQLNLDANNIKVEGVSMTKSGSVEYDRYSRIVIGGDNITIERCYFGDLTWKANTSGKNTTVRQSYLNKDICGLGTTDTNSENCVIENCIILNRYKNAAIHKLYTPIIRNCTFVGGAYSSNDCMAMETITGGEIKNNLILATSSNGMESVLYTAYLDNCTVSGNVLCSTDTSYPTFPDNRFLSTADVSTVLAGTNQQVVASMASDALFRLKAESPALDYPDTGDECGAFGGATPYVLSGLPKGYPYYTSVSVSSAARNGKIKVSLQATVQDE